MTSTRNVGSRAPVKTALALAIAMTAGALLATAADAPTPAAGVPAAAAEQGRHQRGHGPREIDLAAAETRAKAAFDRVDSNDDERISPAEIAAAGPGAFGRDGMRRHGRGHHGMPGHGRGGAHRFHTGPGPDAMGGRMGPAHGGAAGERDSESGDDAPGDNAARGRGDREQRLGAVFQRLDANGDGRLSAEEFSGLRAAQRAEREARQFARMDANGDGSLSRTEFPPMLAHLRQLDANKDGKVTRDEFPARGERRSRHHDAAPRS